MDETLAPPKNSDNPSTESPWLSDISPRHAVWDATKAHADVVAVIYSTADDLRRYSKRVAVCSELLVLNEHMTSQGERSHKASSAKCHCRHCPVCQRARAGRLVVAMEAALAPMVKAHPTGRWLFLTLTVRNCDIHDLRGTLKQMNAAWKRLVERKELSIVQGWLRSTEVTQGKDGKDMAHPHFHVLLFVPSYYFKTAAYIKHEKWLSLWQESARLDYQPSVYIKPVKTLVGGLMEVVKTTAYSVKADEIETAPEWFLEYHRQVHKLRFFATGGLVKEYLLIEDRPADDIAEGQAEGIETGRKMLFDWKRPVKRYRKRQGESAPPAG